MSGKLLLDFATCQRPPPAEVERGVEGQTSSNTRFDASECVKLEQLAQATSVTIEGDNLGFSVAWIERAIERWFSESPVPSYGLSSIVVQFDTIDPPSFMANSTPPCPAGSLTPRIILHGGAGNISHATLPHSSTLPYRHALRRILRETSSLFAQDPSTAAHVAAAHGVSLLENDPLFNAGRGAVFTTAGTNELEASLMVSRGKHKRGVGVMLVTTVKNPILLCREMLERGDERDGGGAGAHVQLSGPQIEELAYKWGCEVVDKGYFWTKRRWEEHRKGLERGKGALVSEDMGALGDEANNENVGKERDGDPSWNGKEYLPQGTVGCVVMDSFGTIAVATSTGGLTNKLPGRIGDTPTLGAGFWAEQWLEDFTSSMPYEARSSVGAASPLDKLSRGDITGVLSDCLPSLAPSSPDASPSCPQEKLPASSESKRHHAVGLSGTGNGDSFLRVAAARTAAAICRFSSPNLPLRIALKRVAGPGGELQQSAEERWGKTGEGEGGIIGIELRGENSSVLYDMNCGGMFRAWVDDEGKERVAVFADEDGREDYDLSEA
ncbi:nucleophile aminohydrolase [Phyllosticta paracitricarpa]|uniref:Nucleophile aminohydrolase n=1 Tax=Phyllosticta paracitricarpa TaxID=2016321 RepID=A0ABR1N5Y1_9PEZI